MLIRASELRMLDVVNVVDGRKLGNVYDVDVDVATGDIRALLIPGRGGFLLWGRQPDLQIPWDRITKIGIDVILVNLPNLAELP